MLGFAGVTPIETKLAGVTVNAVDPETLPLAAVIVADPGLNPVARPSEPEALLIDAMAVLFEDQATVAVRFCVVMSE